MPACPNLRLLSGGRYRVNRDPAYSAEYGKLGRTDDPWLMVIPCQFGHFFPWGADTLAFSTNSRGATANRLAALPFVTLQQEGDDGCSLTFQVDRFDEVAQIARPRRQRRLSAKQRAAASERLASFRFSPARQSDFPGQGCIGE